MNSELLTDKELWQAIVTDDDARAFAALYNRHWQKIYRTANHYLHNPQAAGQILHDVFVTLWERRQHLQIDNFGGYLHIAARYHVFSHLKAARISPVEYIENYDLVNSAVTKNEGEDRLNNDDLESELGQLLNQLPKRCREIFWMSRIEQLSNDEIAEKLGISKRTVENQITHALKHLRLVYGQLAGSAFMMILATILK